MILHEVRRLLLTRLVRRSRLRADTRRVAVAIPTRNRTERVLALLPRLLSDSRVGEVAIRDDASSPEEYGRLAHGVAYYAPRVRLTRNDKNVGAFDNKLMVVADCALEWVVLLDSDNRIGPVYLDAFFALPAWSPRVIYCPQRALPRFDFTGFTGVPFDLQGAAALMRSGKRPVMQVFLNTGNYVVSRDRYMQMLQPFSRCRVAAADVFAANLIWFRSGGLLQALPGMDYAHEVHEGSWFRETAGESKALVRAMGDALATGVEAEVDDALARLRASVLSKGED